MTYQQYFDYFKSIQVLHKELEDFVEFTSSASPFPNLDLHDFLSKAKKLKYPFLLVEGFTASYQNESSNWLKVLNCALLVGIALGKYSTEKKEDALTKCEAIGQQVLSYVYNDFLNTDKFCNYDFRWDSVNSETIGVSVNNIYYVRFDFIIIHHSYDEMNFNPDNFN